MSKLPAKLIKLSDIEIDWFRLIPLMGKAHSSLSNYNGALKHLVNPKILLAPMTSKESTLSSKIEGTQATLTEVLQHEAGESFAGYKQADMQEIANYKTAMTQAVDLLNNRPFIHLNLVKQIHFTLLDGVRGNGKARGEFRTTQNWIGKKGSDIENASYIPPSPTDLINYLTEWENFVNYEYNDVLVQLAITHAQFEIIHPFLDGNGRLGRILIPIFLYSKQYLTEPIFYLSEYLEKHRDEYYEKLSGITANNNWQDWIEFFLTAIIEQSNKNQVKIKEIIELYNEQKNIIQSVTKSQYTTRILDAIFSKPIFTVASFSENASIPNKNTASSIINKLLDNNVIIQIREGSGNRGSMFKFETLINIIDD